MPSLSVASSCDAAVDIPIGAGDSAGGRGKRERGGVGLVVGGTGPAERMEVVIPVRSLSDLALGGEPLLARGGDDRRSDGFEPDVVSGDRLALPILTIARP